MSIEEKLNKLLQYYIDNPAPEEVNLQIISNILGDDLRPAEEKIVRDGFFRRGPLGDLPDVYSLTIEGKIFMANGGYVKKKSNERLVRFLRIIEAVSLLIFSGIGAVYAGLEIYSYCFESTQCHP